MSKLLSELCPSCVRTMPEQICPNLREICSSVGKAVSDMLSTVLEDPCLSDPCLYGGTCHVTPDGGYKCDCISDRYEQPRCTGMLAIMSQSILVQRWTKQWSHFLLLEPADCMWAQCQNGATCYENTDHELDENGNIKYFTCICKYGWTGKFCNVSTLIEKGTTTEQRTDALARAWA